MIVLMFHSIGCEKENWYRNWLSISLEHFDRFCIYLVENKYETIFLDDWYDNKKHSVSNKQVVLTFDDGYLDNWVYAYPILEKYNLKGTLFINPEFIDSSEQIRYNLNDVWSGKIRKSQLAPLGFLNWTELQTMQTSGVMDIQSHSMSHNFYFYSNKIKDIYEEQPEYDWMAWLKKPSRKPYYPIENQNHFTAKGTPIFEFGRALGLRRYFPDEELIKYAVEKYVENENLADKDKFISKLNEKLKTLPGIYESDEDMERRYRYELFESKRILEKKLGKTIDFLCWPGGGYNELSLKLSIEAGYKASTGRFKIKTFIDGNGNSKDYKNITRSSMTSFISTNRSNYYMENPNFLITLFRYHNGSFIHKYIYRANKLWLMLTEKLSK